MTRGLFLLENVPMRKIYVSIIAGLFSVTPLSAQVAADYAIQLNVITQVNPPQITLQWKKLAGATSYTIYKKSKTSPTWTTLGTLPATDTSFSDAAVIVDSAYEYKMTNAGSPVASGYIYAGIKAPAMHNRGTLILLVDSTFRDSCSIQIAQLMEDMRGDGWGIIRHDVGRSTPVPFVRAMIQTDYASHTGVNALLLLGHIPVPYSGDLNPDGHPDHKGAWPTDAYYADVDGTWTDVSVNDTVATRSQNKNKPGDGKWDQTALPSTLELQVGRIDFANMPSIPRTEIQLMRNYLNKAHWYKMDSLSIMRKAVVDDNFGAFSGEAFAANAWRLFPTVIGRNNILAADFINTLKDSAYQWAYGCGAGSYTTANGIGATADFNTKSVKGIFTMLFGSYFGDFDANNNFLRAPLCAPEPALTSCWAGRPNWFMHHMALGENIGYSARLSQNNTGSIYAPANAGAYWVHVALMGDPTLRTNYIKQPSNLSITPMPNMGATVSWNASSDAGVIGYYVYRCDSAWGNYIKLSGLIAGTSFNDIHGADGKKFYLVRPVKLQQTPSGGYYNLGVGILDSANVSFPLAVAGINNSPQISLFPNPAGKRLNAIIETTSSNNISISLVNLNGSVLVQENKILHAGENSFSWDISNWPAGLYALMLQCGEGKVVRKWVKMDAQ